MNWQFLCSRLALSTVLLLFFGLVQAQQSAPQNNEQIVSIHGTGNPVDKSYRKMMAGADVFEENHQLAPNATLRFKLLRRLPDTNMDGIVLKIVGDTVSIPVPIAADNTFSLERNQQALDEDASVLPNRKAHSMTWRADIRTPGLPPNTRRLGDIRLECQVGFKAGLISEGVPLASAIGKQVLYLTGNLCDHYLLFSDAPLFKVTMVSGQRKMDISIDDMYGGLSYQPGVKVQLPFCDCQSLIDRTYLLPLGDKSWPDDALIQFEYMENDATAETRSKDPV